MSLLGDSRSLHFYCQILFWVEHVLAENKERPIFIGLNAPQGAGKTTLTRWLADQLEEKNINALSLSIDDFYLTHDEQLKLAEKNPHNPYLQQRGYPGTHDIQLGLDTLNQLKSSAREVALPRYIKSAHQGQGDRSPREFWTQANPPFDVIFLEGWSLGFLPVADVDGLKTPMKAINENLNSYSSWNEFLLAFIYLYPLYENFVIEWRGGAEQKILARSKHSII